MPKFTLVCDHSCDLDTHVVTHQFNCENLYDVIENFDMFLKGAGYSYDGVLDICTPVETSNLTGHSPQYFDTGRNR